MLNIYVQIAFLVMHHVKKLWMKHFIVLDLIVETEP